MMDNIYYWLGAIMFWANFILGLAIFLVMFFIKIVHENTKYFNKLSQYIIDKKEFKEWQTEKKNRNKIKSWNPKHKCKCGKTKGGSYKCLRTDCDN